MYVYAQSEPERDVLVFNVTIGHDANRQHQHAVCTTRQQALCRQTSSVAGAALQ